jgi:CBS-domain-containing membrane protein
MSTRYVPLLHVPLDPGSHYARPPELPELVHMDSPALEVMTDLRTIRAVTTKPDVSIDAALDKMKIDGVRLLLVIGAGGELIGLVTARDIQGEKPIQLARETGIEHARITVEMIMTPPSQIQVLNMLSVRNAQVGHIVATLRELERQHTLVVEVDGTSGRQTVRGIFSTSQISRQLGVDVTDAVSPAHSLAEIQQEIG